MENNSERLHYAIALGLGVVGLLIILIFVSIRSQADDTTSSVSITNSTPTIDSNDAYGNTSSTADASFTLDVETNAVSNSVSTSFYSKFTYTDANGCSQINENPGTEGFYMYKAGTSGCTGTSTASRNCINSNSSGYSCTTALCTAGGTDTTASVICEVKVPYNSENNSWTLRNYIYDGSVWVSSDVAMTFDSSNAIKITSSTTNTAKSTINFGSVAVGATSSIDTVAVYNLSNSTSTLSFSGTRMNCSGTNSNYIPTTSIKYSFTNSVAGVFNSGTALTVSTAAVSIFGTTPSFSVGGTSAVSTSYWGLDISSTSIHYGLAGTCTGTVSIVKG